MSITIWNGGEHPEAPGGCVTFERLIIKIEEKMARVGSGVLPEWNPIIIR
jgi:hypothetical protein